jgi:hypothetical protein
LALPEVWWLLHAERLLWFVTNLPKPDNSATQVARVGVEMDCDIIVLSFDGANLKNYMVRVDGLSLPGM